MLRVVENLVGQPRLHHARAAHHHQAVGQQARRGCRTGRIRGQSGHHHRHPVGIGARGFRRILRTVDKLSIRVLVDSSYDLFFKPKQSGGVTIAPPPRGADYQKSLHNEWGLSLWLESETKGAQRTLMLDYGYTPEVLLNNMALVGVDPSKLDALIVSHGHYDHFGGLNGFLDKFRDKLPADVKLYAGGEDNFCHRVSATPTKGQ